MSRNQSLCIRQKQLSEETHQMPFLGEWIAQNLNFPQIAQNSEPGKAENFSLEIIFCSRPDI